MVSPVHGDYRRLQAETPLIVLFKFAEPALNFSISRIEELTAYLLILHTIPTKPFLAAIEEPLSREAAAVIHWRREGRR
ncbi:hypothetical protein [Bradyrhizobium sp. WSM1417]|uniref:hypothetical protein n=1 Tax=Bradyrhizobium sp. WSM1417 TaxID=754500 RepID=UPI0012EC0079|nr:hypothetical protein [Bradyrhizobium sp. WSM1417]